MKKQVIALLIAFLMLIASLCACSGTAKNEGSRLASNVARMYENSERKSHFMLDAQKIEGEVPGMAFMSTSAFGDTSLAWVGSTLYFVSSKGIDKLGTGIETAELSFDGRVALWLDGGTLYKYCVDDRSTTPLVEGLESIVQISISPKSETILCTVVYANEDGGEYVTLICDKDGVKEYSHSMICFAVSDDADIVYYYDMTEKALTVKQGDEAYAISTNCNSATNYNFTRNLKELTYSDADGLNHLFVLDTKADTTMGSGFGVTEKTDVFSISTITFFTYINDIDSFRGGVWMERRTVDGSYVYDLGFINSAGEVNWLVQNAVQYFVTPDQSRIIWLGLLDKLSSTRVSNGKTVELAGDVYSFDTTADGSRVYYLTMAKSLFTVKGTGKAQKAAASVMDYAVMGDVCAYITEDGALHYANAANTYDVADITKAASFDKRAGMLILYANQKDGDDGETYVYDAYCSADGMNYSLAFGDIEP